MGKRCGTAVDRRVLHCPMLLERRGQVVTIIAGAYWLQLGVELTPVVGIGVTVERIDDILNSIVVFVLKKDDKDQLAGDDPDRSAARYRIPLGEEVDVD